MISRSLTVSVVAIAAIAWLIFAGWAAGLGISPAPHGAAAPAPRIVQSLVPSASIRGWLAGHAAPSFPGRPATLNSSWWNITNESSTQLPIFWFTEGTWDAADGYLMFYGGDDFAGANLANSMDLFGGGVERADDPRFSRAARWARPRLRPAREGSRDVWRPPNLTPRSGTPT